MELSEKIKILRGTEGLTQEKMSELLKISKSAYQKYELNERKPEYEVMEKLCKKFPEYTLWIMTGEVNLPNQTAPHLKADDGHKKMA